MRPPVFLSTFGIAIVFAALPRAVADAQYFAGKVVEDSTSRPLVRLQVTLWRWDAPGLRIVDSTISDDAGRFEVLGDGTGVYRLRFGWWREPVGSGPVDTISADSAMMRLYRIPLLRVGAADAFSATQVQHMAVPLDGNVEARYPKELKKQCVDGDVLPSVVIDENGRADMSTFKIIGASHDDFAESVRDAVSRARFRPAEIGGVRVRQLISAPVHFRAQCRR